MFWYCFFLKWCRSGLCVLKTAAFEKYTAISKPILPDTSEKSNLIDDRKYGNFMKSEHSINRPTLVNDVEQIEDWEELVAFEEVSLKLFKIISKFKKKNSYQFSQASFFGWISAICLVESSDYKVVIFKRLWCLILALSIVLEMMQNMFLILLLIRTF